MRPHRTHATALEHAIKPGTYRVIVEGLPIEQRGEGFSENRHLIIVDPAAPEDSEQLTEPGTFSPLLKAGIGLAYLWPADVVDFGA